MSLKLAGKIVLPAVRQIVLEGLTVITLTSSDMVLEITSQSGTGVDVRLLQVYPFADEGRMLWIWNNSGATANIGRNFTDPGYHITAYDMPLQTILNGGVLCYRFYVDGGPAGAPWATWHQV
jgi:hypothetical protein